jgi:hypothetical protein
MPVAIFMGTSPLSPALLRSYALDYDRGSRSVTAPGGDAGNPRGSGCVWKAKQVEIWTGRAAGAAG